jgi:P-type E1-E2 ATPase
MEKVDTLVVDKTGTLTEGKPSVTRVLQTGSWDEQQVLRMAGALEQASEHPLARAIVEEARGVTRETEPLPTVDDFDAPAGQGVTGTVDGHRILVGSPGFLEDHGIDTAVAAGDADTLRAEGATAVFVAVDQQIAGIIAIADQVKESTPEALAGLRSAGIDVVMLTGDNRVTAEAVARRLGIEGRGRGPAPGPGTCGRDGR